MIARVLPLTPERAARYGRIVALAAAGGDGAGADGGAAGVCTMSGPGWRDARSLEPLLGSSASVGLTRSGGVPEGFSEMERHTHTPEAICCVEQDLVLALAPADATPRAEEVEVLRLPAGTVLVLDPGTWHSPAYGSEGPVGYLWWAALSPDDIEGWVQIVDGPVTPERDHG